MESEPRVSVNHIGDLNHTPSGDVVVVASDADYVRACEVIAQAGASGSGLEVWVRSTTHHTWLRHFTEQIGCPAQFREMTARLIVADRWLVTMPDWLTDNDVLQNDLLEMEIAVQGAAAQRVHFAERLLTQLLGPVFQSPSLHAENLAEVVRALIDDKAKRAFRTMPILARCLQDECETWARQDGEVWVAEACRMLQTDADELWQWLSLWACLHGYPEKLLEFVLPLKHAVFVRQIPLDAVADLALHATAREQALAQITLFLESVKGQVAAAGDFRELVARTSGKLVQEYRFVTDLLKQHRFPPTTDDVDAVRARFRSCPGVSESDMAALDYLVMPERPASPGPDEVWGWQRWVQWTTKEYAPYRDWQLHNQHYDDPVEKTVARFSTWYVDAYPTIHADPELSLAHSLNDLGMAEAEASLSIVLLIDCLPISFASLMDKALRNVGFSRHALQYRFALLPSDTAHNKPLLVSGTWENGAGDYATLLSQRAVADWNGRQALYVGSLKALSELPVPQSGAVILLNFTEGDKTLHSDVESINSTYEEELRRLFVRIADVVATLAEAWSGPKEQVSVHVVTDHGACRILDEEKRSLDSSVVQKLFPDEKHRYAVVDEKQRAAVPASLWDLGHDFRSPFAPDGPAYFLPKGHNTVRRATQSKGYMHGGVTPEEVIVPVARYKLVKAAWQPPAARFPDVSLNRETGRAEFYIQRVVPLRVEIQNSNPVDLQILRASVTAPETDVKASEAPVIPAGSTETVQIDCYFQRSAVGTEALELEIVYELAGEEHVLPLTLDAEFKSAMSRGFRLRDL